MSGKPIFVFQICTDAASHGNGGHRKTFIESPVKLSEEVGLGCSNIMVFKFKYLWEQHHALFPGYLWEFVEFQIGHHHSWHTISPCHHSSLSPGEASIVMKQQIFRRTSIFLKNFGVTL